MLTFRHTTKCTKHDERKHTIHLIYDWGKVTQIHRLDIEIGILKLNLTSVSNVHMKSDIRLAPYTHSVRNLHIRSMQKNLQMW